jgi:hypothetical protein
VIHPTGVSPERVLAIDRAMKNNEDFNLSGLPRE